MWFNNIGSLKSKKPFHFNETTWELYLGSKPSKCWTIFQLVWALHPKETLSKLSWTIFTLITGQVARSSSTGGSKAALVKYSIFAWITPVVVVTTSVVLDKTDAVFVGYGECKLSFDKIISSQNKTMCALVYLSGCGWVRMQFQLLVYIIVLFAFTQWESLL